MRRSLVLLPLALLWPAIARAQDAREDSIFISQFLWRSIGPANMGGRVSDVEANPRNPKVIYVALATGGLWKTVNAGVTWQPLFDAQPVASVSEIAIAPSDTSIIWAGTGEEDSRNSISPGRGVFKSTDAGRTWTPMGLAETQHIGRIVIDPEDPNVVYVAALGRAWGPNRERGLYKTTDGGRTWTQSKFVSERAGFVEIAMDPSNRNVLLAASWERQRTPYSLQSGGPGSALWRTTDAGAGWTRVSGGGWPATTLGRIGVAFAPSSPRIVYAMVEADSNPNPASLRRGFVADTSRRQRLLSGLYRSEDGGSTWARMHEDNNRPFYYSQVRVDPRKADRVYWMGARLSFSNDGGRTARRVGQGTHSDYHAMWINPSDPDHYILGEDGGVDITYDRGRTYDHIMQMALGQFYAVGLDMQRPFWVCGGLQDNGTWCGPSRTARRTGILNQDWVNVGGGDGFYSAIDPTDPDIMYVESQGGNISRLDLRTWQRRPIRPAGLPLDRLLEDSMIVARGDTIAPPSPEAQRALEGYRARIVADSATRPRFNWQTPFFLSPHNPRTIYLGANRLYKSVDRGDRWIAISDDLSTRDSTRIRVSTRTTGGITRDVTNAETHGTITTVAESPLRPGILWAGTDDGNVWLSTSDGASWTSLTGRFPGVPPRTWVSRVEPSRFDTATAYVAFDGHRDDNFQPLLFVTRDFGRTFRSIAANLPADHYLHVVREDPRRRDLLFVGTEFAAFVSRDGGGRWHRLMRGMPTVPVHDLAIHPRDQVLVAGTHGRSVFTMDIGPLEEATDSILAAPAHLFAAEPAFLYTERTEQASVGHKRFTASNPPFGARIAYRIAGTPAAGDTAVAAAAAATGGPGAALGALMQAEAEAGEAAAGQPEGPGGRRAGRAARPDTLLVVVTGPLGDTVRTFRVSGAPGLHWAVWDLRKDRPPLGPAARRDSIRMATRARAVRDSVRAAMRADTARAARRPSPGTDPEPGEPGTPVPPAGLGGPGGFRGFGAFAAFGRFGGFGGAGAGAPVAPGDYVVNLRINGVNHRQVVRVERPGGALQSAIAGPW